MQAGALRLSSTLQFTAWLGWGKRGLRERRGERRKPFLTRTRRPDACPGASRWQLRSAWLEEQTGNPCSLCRDMGKTPKANSRGSLLSWRQTHNFALSKPLFTSESRGSGRLSPLSHPQSCRPRACGSRRGAQGAAGMTRRGGLGCSTQTCQGPVRETR